MAANWAVAAGARIAPSQGPIDYDALADAPVLYEDADRAPDGREEALFHLINMAARTGGGLLITARTAPSAWPVALADLRSRLNALMVAEIEEPDDAVLTAVIRKLFKERHVVPADDLIPYLLPRIERSAAAVRALVIELDEKSAAERREINRALAQELFKVDNVTIDMFGSGDA